MGTAATEASPRVTTECECWYEYSKSAKDALERAKKGLGHHRIDRSDDPRWEGELMQPPYSGDPKGYVVCATVTRLDGVEVRERRIGHCGYGYSKNKAQEFIAEFERKKAAGSPTPWDQESFYRDAAANAERLEREGRKEDRELLLEAIRIAMSGKQPAPATPETKTGAQK